MYHTVRRLPAVDEHPGINPDLRCSETHPRGRVHRFKEIPDQLLQLLAEGDNGGRRAVEYRLAGDDNGKQ
jgi:hypothetical protein